jgi:Fe-S-cluster containining protein
MTTAKQPGETVTAEVNLSGPDWRLQASMTVPTGATTLRQMLPMVRSLADTVVDVGVRRAEAQGQSISCKKGCGACCRQLVPISQTEAQALVDLVEAMPEPRRSQIRARFAEARRKLETAGFLEVLLDPDNLLGDSQDFGVRYFGLGIPCPFLEEESCSIYQDRPVACREYLVTSPAENCVHPTAVTVQCVPMPLPVSKALGQLTGPPPKGRSYRWVPLILAPEWAEKHCQEPPTRPGPEWLRELFQRMTGKNIPASPPSS